MSQIDDGGPAFPNLIEWDPNGQVVSKGSQGMTLRDWFAGQALAAATHRLDHPHERRGVLARDCYIIADAMLAQRRLTERK